MNLRLLPILVLALLASSCAPSPVAPAAAGVAPMLQAPAGQPFEPWLKAERERVARQREAAQQRYRDEELVCWRRFAVNDCLGEAKRERRGQLDVLRQQDLQLNALERERRTAQRLREIEQKAAPAPGAPSVERRQ